MSDRSDDTGSTPEVSGNGGTEPQPAQGDPAPPPTAETATDRAAHTGPDPADITAAPDADRLSAATEAPAARTGEPAETDGPFPKPVPPATDAPPPTEDPAADPVPPASDGTPTQIAPAVATDPVPPASDGTPTQIAPAVATAPVDDPAAPEPSRHPRNGATVAEPTPPHGTDAATVPERPTGTAFLTARGLTAKGRQGPVFTDVSLTAHLGQLVAVCGDGGDGRTSLLLALTGRFAHRHGTLEVDGQTRPGQIRRRFTIAQAGPPIRFEPYATVGACIKETTTVSKGTATRANINAWLDRLAVGIDTGDTIGFLPRIDQIRFAIACAAASRTPAIAVDDTDTGLDTAGSARVFEALRTVADAGQLVIAACTRSDPPADTVVDLRDQHPTTARTPHHEDRPADRPRRRERTRNGGPR